jgi:carbonic anhydrase
VLHWKARLKPRRPEFPVSSHHFPRWKTKIIRAFWKFQASNFGSDSNPAGPGRTAGKSQKKEKSMSTTDEVVAANQDYARDFRLGHLPMPPARKLAIVACMDARLTVEPMLGLKTGEAHIIRNAGGIVTEDVLRSLIISHHLLGTQEFIVINHTDCGMLTFKDEDLRTKLTEQTGNSAVAPGHFHAFSDLKENVRRQIHKIQSHPWIPRSIPIRGFIYDVKTGKLEEVSVKRAVGAD